MDACVYKTMKPISILQEEFFSKKNRFNKCHGLNSNHFKYMVLVPPEYHYPLENNGVKSR